jgi:multisubunit Na+/H+ antiporter MnhC subunit
MAILGLLILAAATALGVETVLATRSTDVGFHIWGESFTAPLAVVFLLGAVVMTVAILGTFLITGAFQRRRARRVESKHRLRREETETRLGDVDRTNAELVEENERLRGELAAERRAAATMGGVAVPPGTGSVAYGDQVSDAVRSDTISDTGRFEPYPTETAAGTGDTIDVRDGDRQDDKAGIVGRFRGNH